MNYQIDELDRGIMKFMSKDGRMSFTELASKLNVTEKTVRARYKNLLDQKIFEIVGVINPIAIGLKESMIVQIKAKTGTIEDIVGSLQQIREVRYITLTSGPYQLLTQLNASGPENMAAVIRKLNDIEGILEINSIVQLEVFKNTFEYL